jgi:ribose/xylose/arabinose/galactoside ABC-type transport system permease subunit
MLDYYDIIAGTFLFSAIRDILTVTKISVAGRELFQGLLILLVILMPVLKRKCVCP